jgi:hypothetical protein
MQLSSLVFPANCVKNKYHSERVKWFSEYFLKLPAHEEKIWGEIIREACAYCQAIFFSPGAAHARVRKAETYPADWIPPPASDPLDKAPAATRCLLQTGA